MSIRTLYRRVKNNLFSNDKINTLYNNSVNDYKSSKVNLGQIQSNLNSLKTNIKSLAELEFQVFSQFGDDGIIQWLVKKIPSLNKTFIEFGVEDYTEANTRFLLINNYWSGLIMDGSESNILKVNNSILSRFYDLQAEQHFITAENINTIISNANYFSKEIGLLNVDIDGNDYWVWKSINQVDPVIVVCEYNALFGFEHAFTIPYDKNFVRGTNLPFNFYGASLLSLCDLAEFKGYDFLGCNSAGNNAYFIKKDYRHYIDIPFTTPEESYLFCIFSELLDANENPYRGSSKVTSLDGTLVYDTRLNKIVPFNSAEVINSLHKKNKLTRN